MFSPEFLSKLNEVVPEGVTHVGVVAFDSAGAVAISTPVTPKFGVTHNLPRVSLRPGERPADGLVRCLTEAIRCSPASSFPMPKVWATPNSRTFYFACFVPHQAPAGTGSTTWYPLSRARSGLEGVSYAPTRKRNLDVLGLASAFTVSPYRRVLEMVKELHAMGYERLRAPAYMYPLAWRCPVVPASWTLREHGGMFHEPSYSKWPAKPTHKTTYSSANGQFELFADFPARNLEFASPRELAAAFVELRSEFAFAGWGPDLAYVEWFRHALNALGPHGVYYAFGEFEESFDGLYTHHGAVETIRKPPPGWSTKSEWDAFDERHSTDL